VENWTAKMQQREAVIVIVWYWGAQMRTEMAMVGAHHRDRICSRLSLPRSLVDIDCVVRFMHGEKRKVFYSESLSGK
jgi:hypothetical protein